MTEQPLILPIGCILRRACAQDIWAIRKLVLSAKLDPTQVRWSQFWVIESEGGVENLSPNSRLRLASLSLKLRSPTRREALIVPPSLEGKGDRGLGFPWTFPHDVKSQVVACGQLRSFAQAQELGSLVVASAWRNRGLGSFLVQHLIQEATEPLYLECLGSRLAKFYTRFGFVPIAWQELPQSLKWKFGLSQVASKLLPRISVTLMQYREFGE